MKRLARNYENTRDLWGYSTICDECKREIEWRGPPTKYYRKINFNKVVKGFPLSECNFCYKKVKSE